MINIITNKNKIKQLEDSGCIYIDEPEANYGIAFNNLKNAKDIVSNVVRDIDNCETTDKGIISKFNKTELPFDYISEGSKTIIFIYSQLSTCDKKIINITGCGPNAIEYILKHFNNYNLTMFLGHTSYPENVAADFKLNDVLFHNTDDIFKDYEELLE